MNDIDAMHAADAAALVDTLLAELEAEMPLVQQQNPGAFAIANAWAERHDAILACTPPELREHVEGRLSRIGIRWGVMAGARVTCEFQALGGGTAFAGGGPKRPAGDAPGDAD